MNPDLWRTNPALAAFSLAPLILGAVWMIAAPRQRWLAPPAAASAAAWLTWIVTRFGFAALMWGVLGHRSIDLDVYFVPQAAAALRGLVPYRDFPSAHAPLFPYLIALPYRLAGPYGISAFFVAADLVAWRVLAARDRRLGVDPLHGAAWWYAAFPAIWFFLVRYNQDESLSAVFIALALSDRERGAPLRAGLWLGMGALASKALLLLAAVPFLLPAPGVRKTWLGLVAPLALVEGGLWLAGVPVFEPIALHRAAFGTGPSAWLLPVAWTGLELGARGWIPFVALTVAGLAWLWRRGAPVPAAGVWVYASFALFSPKLYVFYLIIWAPLLAAWAARARSPASVPWALYGVLAPLSLVLESGPLQGMFGPVARAVAVTGLLAMPAAAIAMIVSVSREVAVASRVVPPAESRAP